MKTYRNPNPSLWSGRRAHELLYGHQWVHCLPFDPKNQIPPQSFVWIGYATDVGVKRNQGRVGARWGPKYVRKAFGKLPIHLDLKRKCFDVGDVGHVKSLEDIQIKFSQILGWSLVQRAFPIVVGGGHDGVYPHAIALQTFLKSNRPKARLGILNLDAHFDCRNPKDQMHSGNSFSKLMALEDPPHCMFLGIREEANDKRQFEFVHQHGLPYFLLESCQKPVKNGVFKALAQWIDQVDAIYLTIDLDGFDVEHAPGVSAPSPRGFSISFVYKIIDLLAASGKWSSMDIAEFNPKYDQDHRTARLGASLIYRAIHQLDKNLNFRSKS